MRAVADVVNQGSDAQPAARKRNGGRSARVREAVLRATWEALLELGVDGLNFSEIGRRAGVHGTSVQRRWGSKENVLFDALLSFGTEAIPVPDTGSLRGDLVAMSRTLSAYFASPIGGSILQMFVANADNDRAFADHRAEFMRIRFDAMRMMIRRAADRGELRAGIDEETALDLALGPLYVRALITRQPIDDAFIESFVDILLTGLLAKGAST
ncbi:TetR-like C-terminal domain-containing protein [Sphingomonas sp. M1-B02]|uniref:TetR-like C-terminal domain-containing protein n=1 Tax=Sphingomonas sp. M1-B02 TaxID=3114300 RepID=UPI00224096DD|nr:TetR-like C-terminal domain-containing protein [Sphingomonas sp. S6-11]UZK67942.1 TetR/AcrR family transcriptional regulator [Sphingomonas sp. S6-11]